MSDAKAKITLGGDTAIELDKPCQCSDNKTC